MGELCEFTFRKMVCMLTTSLNLLNFGKVSVNGVFEAVKSQFFKKFAGASVKKLTDNMKVLILDTT